MDVHLKMTRAMKGEKKSVMFHFLLVHLWLISRLVSEAVSSL